MVIDNGQIFISEKESVYIYSLEDFKLVDNKNTEEWELHVNEIKE
jgi:hypothetical protein